MKKLILIKEKWPTNYYNDFYFDSKLEDFGHDKLFSEIKSNCDLFINKFKMDKYEEKKISDLEKFL